MCACMCVCLCVYSYLYQEVGWVLQEHHRFRLLLLTPFSSEHASHQ
jgi:hypothetical protein